jgi:hypothetical protein
MITRVCVALALAFSGCDQARVGHPSDAQLLERFRSHREELEALVRMFEEDAGLGRVGASFTRPEDPGRVGVSEQRIREYRRLCAAVGAPDCIEGYDATFDRLYGAVEPDRTESKDPIWIHVSGVGLSISGSSKGFAYSPSPPFPVVADLDLVSPTRSGTWLRRIEGNWYLYYEYED